MCALWFNSPGQPGNPTLNTEIGLYNKPVSKSAMLDSITLYHNIHFSYNPQLLNSESKVQFTGEVKRLYEILQLLIADTPLNYKVFNNQVVFFPIVADEKEKPVPEFIVLKGTVTEYRNSEPVPYCNISIVGKALGTMANLNGQFAVKVPVQHFTDTLAFSSLGFETYLLPLSEFSGKELAIGLAKKTYFLRSIDVIRYDPQFVLDQMDRHLMANYSSDYSLYTSFYRETIKENTVYTDISEAVLQLVKAPYNDQGREDHVKFIKGRKGAQAKPLNDINFRLKGGPYYITKLDVVKNRESFLSPELRHLYAYSFDRTVTIDNRQTAILSFKPILNLRDVLFEGKLYIDTETWGIARVEFQYTRHGLKASHNALVLKVPKKHTVIPTELSYVVQYKYLNGQWHLLSARSSFHIRINNRERKERTRFHSIAELLTTNIEKGGFQQFSRKEIFRPNEIFTDKIVGYDKDFWENYNTIEPEESLEKALKDFDNQNLMIIYKN
jgi:hypothetical protein